MANILFRLLVLAALPLLHEGEPVAVYHESPNTQMDHSAQVVGQVQQ